MLAATQVLPKAELHVHLEGTVGADLAQRLARRNKIELSESLLDGSSYRWTTFSEFLAVYDAVAATIRTAEDYRDVAESYLLSVASEGAVYAELTISPRHAEQGGIGWSDHLDAVAEGALRARERTGIEARLIVTALRHEDPSVAVALVNELERNSHELVTGFGLAGDEQQRPASEFTEAFERASALGLGCTIHAGEFCGPDSVRAALALPVTRVGHGVRALEDAALVRQLAASGIVLEVCPSSNVALGVSASWERHPLRALYDAGVKVTLNSDDPPHFATTLGAEYRKAQERLGFTTAELTELTGTALKAAFVDEPTRQRLQERLASST